MRASRPPHLALQVGDEAAFSTELARLMREPPRLARMRLAAQQYSTTLQHTLKQQPSVSAAVDDFEAHLRTAMCRRAPAAGRPIAAGGRLTGRLALLLWLYGLQGATFGLVGGALPVLVSGAPLAALGLLSLSLLPFALKVCPSPPLAPPRRPSPPLAPPLYLLVLFPHQQFLPQSPCPSSPPFLL